jgi:hypothetical protein
MLRRLVNFSPLLRRRSSAKLQITLSGTVETSDELPTNTNSNLELGLRTDLNEPSEKPTALPERRSKKF